MKAFFVLVTIVLFLLTYSVSMANFTDIVTIKLETIEEKKFSSELCVVKGYVTEIEFTNSLDKIGSGIELDAKCDLVSNLASGNEIKVYKDKEMIYEYDLISSEKIDISNTNTGSDDAIKVFLLLFLVGSASTLSFVFLK